MNSQIIKISLALFVSLLFGGRHECSGKSDLDLNLRLVQISQPNRCSATQRAQLILVGNPVKTADSILGFLGCVSFFDREKITLNQILPASGSLLDQVTSSQRVYSRYGDSIICVDAANTFRPLESPPSQAVYFGFTVSILDSCLVQEKVFLQSMVIYRVVDRDFIEEIVPVSPEVEILNREDTASMPTVSVRSLQDQEIRFSEGIDTVFAFRLSDSASFLYEVECELEYPSNLEVSELASQLKAVEVRDVIQNNSSTKILFTLRGQEPSSVVQFRVREGQQTFDSGAVVLRVNGLNQCACAVIGSSDSIFVVKENTVSVNDQKNIATVEVKATQDKKIIVAAKSRVKTVSFFDIMGRELDKQQVYSAEYSSEYQIIDATPAIVVYTIELESGLKRGIIYVGKSNN